MFVDASALLHGAERRHTPPVAIYEAALGLRRIGRTAAEAATAVVENFLRRSGTEVISISPDIGRVAIEAFARFGRGNHPARLNMGDCFAYVCARSLGVPLLAKGEDFPQTDIELA